MLHPDQKIAAESIFVKGITMAISNADDRAENLCVEAITGLERAGATGIDRVGVTLPEPLDLPPTVSSIDRPIIILADDDAVMCGYLQQLLSQSYQVEIATDGLEAMRAIDRQQPDLVLTDVLMPNLDGLELLRSIRANPATQDIPVILLSAHDSEESRIAGLEAGADDYLVKPFSARELVARVGATLRLARLRLNADNRERALQQETDTAKANLDQIVTNLNNGFATFDRQWRYTYANNRLLEIFKLSRAEVIGKRAWEVFPHQVSVEFFDLLHRAMTARVEVQFEYYYEIVGCWVEHCVYPTDDGLAILMADVSDRKRTELLAIEQTKLLELAALDLRESETEYRTLFESIDEGFCIVEMLFDTDEQPVDYRFEQVNPAFFSLTGLPADAVGKSMREMVPGLEDFWMETYGKVALTGEAARFENYSVPMNRWFDVYAARVGDAASRRVAIVFTNITERKQAEKISQRAAKFDAFRIALADALRPLTSPVEIQATASRVLGEYLGANRVLYFEIRGTNYFVERDYINGATSLHGSYPLESFSAKMLAAHRAGRTMSGSDLAADPDLSPEQKAAYAAIQVGAHIDVPLVKGGEFIAGLAVHASEPREWTPDEIDLAEEVAERTWAAVERARAEVALQESEAKYRTLFESIDEGYILIEMLFDATDRPIDFCYLDANPAAVAMLGENPIGRQAREFLPSIEGHWFETLGRVAQTGIGERDELDASSLGAWYNFYAFSIDNADSRQVAVIFEDITARKRREANTAFLTTIQDDFARLTTADEIIQIVGEKLSRYLNAARCLFAEIDEAQERAIIEYNSHSTDIRDLVGVYQLSEFVSAEFQQAARARETIIIGNTQTDARTDADRHAALNVHAFVSVPFHRGNDWKYLLTVNDVRSRDWREDEIELISEVANRLFPRVERARAEAEVAANLRDTQLLRELGARLVSEDDSHTLYREILAAAIDLTGADAGTLQILDESTQDLCIIASQGFESFMTTHFARVDASSDTSCGIAINHGIRTFVDFDVPHPDPHGSMRLHLEAGLLSAQSTPLVSRTGKAIGMVSTHWHTRHRPSDRQLQFLDLLARQAADTIEQRQTTAALRDREEQLRLATAASKLGLWFWNIAADTLTWTEQCKAIFGLPADMEVSHEIFMATLHPDDRQRTQDAVDRSIAERTDYDIEYRSCWPDGTVHWIAAKGSCTYNTTGTPIQMMGVTIDITDRKRVEEALRDSEAQLAAEVIDMQQLQQISSQLISEDNIDALYQQIVDAAIALMDADLGTLYTIDPDRNQLRMLASRGLHPTAVEHWQSVSLDSNTASGKAAASGEPTLVTDVETCNLPFGSVDLDCARLSGIRSVHSTPLISRTGRIVGTICTQWRTPHQPSVRRLRLLDVLARQVADLLDRKLAEESLRESQTRLRFMLDASEIGEWDLDLTTQPYTAYRSLRHDQIFGYESPLPEWSYDIFLTHVYPDDRAAVAEKFRQTLANDTAWNFECRIVHPDRSIHWIWVRSSVYCDFSGRPIRLLGMVVDFTDRKQAEESLAERARQLADLNSRLAQSEIQLQERNQELNSFVHIVSHDLKAPLRAVANLSQWIEEDFEGTVSANTTEQMNLLRGRIYRMERMIDGLLEYARVGRQDIQVELVPVADLLTEVIESLGYPLGTRIAPPPTFKIDIAAQMPTLAANRLLLSQVFANLIGNAFKHHDRSDGSIRISSRELDDCYEFAICDDGPGIAPEQRDRVFVIFQAANPKKNPDSTGIGLSIVKKIVETAGGRIWLESELGKGTTFYFTWPMRHSIG